MYVPKYHSFAVEDIKTLPKNVKNALRKDIETVLAKAPMASSEPLDEDTALAGFRSYHSGAYRVVFKVYEDLRAFAIVGVGKKGPPDYVYERLERLAATGQLAHKVLDTLRLFSPPK